MKIVIPFDSEEFFTRSERDLLERFQLTEDMAINQVLQNWLVYTLGESHQIYERTVDDLHELFDFTYGYNETGVRLQGQLDEFSHDLTVMMVGVARRLHELLNTIPDDVFRRRYHTGDYHYLEVLEINRPGRYVMLTDAVVEHGA